MARHDARDVKAQKFPVGKALSNRKITAVDGNGANIRLNLIPQGGRMCAKATGHSC